ncbi:hypothetical protein [Pyrobaculum aerophilum]|uniref:Uncharacterized protein n=1 Tax=Pyrobaculum aerophilum TaxID=13773 RepID=A0A371R253_9CREN|nr:hypothetical protein [Pyrobaculum aerophilum]RFA97614.1 hypothetical protein CGL52_08775 [Pyrobaculum aerophilum]RFA98052.1 hypothetical protein CGL51_01520 [Pyrobaculum aerophilum]
MVNIDAVINALIAQAPLIAVVIIVLDYTLNSRIEKVMESLKLLEADVKTQMQHVARKIDQLRQRITTLEQEVTSLNYVARTRGEVSYAIKVDSYGARARSEVS